MKSQEVGLIGVGLLGTAMAERLHASGFKIIGFDVAVSSDAPSFIDFREKQNDLFDRCDTIILSLPNSNIVQSVLDNASIRPQSTIIDTRTCRAD